MTTKLYVTMTDAGVFGIMDPVLHACYSEDEALEKAAAFRDYAEREDEIGIGDKIWVNIYAIDDDTRKEYFADRPIRAIDPETVYEVICDEGIEAALFHDEIWTYVCE